MNRKQFVFLLFIVIWGLTCACGKKKVHVSTPLEGTSAEGSGGLEETVGYASWYGDPYHGRRTSNGETYNKFELTAAHRTLPFDSIVKVDNLENGKDVTVRINDRGPFVKDRIIDLSLSAARKIDMVGPGTAKVRLEVIKVVPNPYPIAIQVGSFTKEDNAKNLQRELSPKFSPIAIHKHQGRDGKLFQVFVGRFRDVSEASRTRNELRKLDLNGLLVRLDR
jgi:rare lipoprotein A